MRFLLFDWGSRRSHLVVGAHLRLLLRADMLAMGLPLCLLDRLRIKQVNLGVSQNGACRLSSRLSTIIGVYIILRRIIGVQRKFTLSRRRLILGDD